MSIFLLSQYPIGKCIHVRTDTWKSKKAKGSTWLKRGMIFNLESSHFFFLALSAVYNQAKTMYALQIYMAYQIIAEFFVSCKQEVIMMLDQCRRDFSALIDRINVQDAFEKADYKDRYNFVNVSLAQ